MSFNTVLQRGFYAGWEIIGNRLFLVSFYGEHYSIRPEGGFVRERDYSLNDLFPGQEKVFADWYTGEFQIPIGKQIDYSYNFIGGIFETSTTLVFKNGIMKEYGLFSLK